MVSRTANFKAARSATQKLSASRLPQKNNDLICCLTLSLVWLATIIVVNPIGDFPLNDDWAYGSTVRVLVQEGDLRFSDWTAINLIAQVFWGALFTLPFGFSFTALRISTLFLGLVGVLATYGVLREVRTSAGLSFFGALVFGFSPIYFLLSFTFMSDVPFAAVATASSWLLIRGLQRESGFAIAGGFVLAGAAILVRQNGLALLIAFAVAYVFNKGLSIREMSKATFPIIGGIALQMGYQLWLRWADRLPANFGSQVKTLQAQLHLAWSSIFTDAALITLYSLVYAGFFLLPFLLVIQRPSFLKAPAAAYWITLVGVATGVTAILFFADNLMPLLDKNIFRKSGLGCCSGLPWNAPKLFWVFVTFASILGVLLLVLSLLQAAYYLASKEEILEKRCTLVFALVAASLTFAPMPLLGFGPHGFYDRYLICILPWLMLAVVTSNVRLSNYRSSRLPVVMAVTGFLFVSAFAVGATHDYLSANRVRWAALNELMLEYKVKPELIDGGFEFNGLHHFGDPKSHLPGVCCNWILGNDYFVSSLPPPPGWFTIIKYPVPQLLPGSMRHIMIQSQTDHSSMKDRK